MFSRTSTNDPADGYAVRLVVTVTMHKSHLRVDLFPHMQPCIAESRIECDCPGINSTTIACSHAPVAIEEALLKLVGQYLSKVQSPGSFVCESPHEGLS